MKLQTLTFQIGRSLDLCSVSLCFIVSVFVHFVRMLIIIIIVLTVYFTVSHRKVHL